MNALARSSKIIGIGNEMRGDDGAGLLAVRAIKYAWPGAVVEELSGETLNLLNAMHGYQHIVLIDCLAGMPEVDHAVIINGLSQSFEENPKSSTHNFSLAEAISLGKVLQLLPQRLTIIGIPGTDFELGHPVSPRVNAIIDRFIQALHLRGTLDQSFQLFERPFDLWRDMGSR